MGEFEESQLRAITRRHFFRDCKIGLGSLALASLLGDRLTAAPQSGANNNPLAPRAGHFPAKAKSVIFLFMAGGPSQLELFDYKPKLQEMDGQVIPESYVKNKRFAFIKKDAKLLGTRRKFAKCGQSAAEIGDLLPHLQATVDDVCLVKSMTTDVFNHGPAKLFVNTGSPQFMGRPSMGAWVTYGIGSESQDLPGFVVLQSGPRGPRGGAALWSSGFLPTSYQGVPFRSGGDPILDLSTPGGVPGAAQQQTLETIRDLNQLKLEETGDAEISTRIAA